MLISPVQSAIEVTDPGTAATLTQNRGPHPPKKAKIPAGTTEGRSSLFLTKSRHRSRLLAGTLEPPGTSAEFAACELPSHCLSSTRVPVLHRMHHFCATLRVLGPIYAHLRATSWAHCFVETCVLQDDMILHGSAASRVLACDNRRAIMEPPSDCLF